MNLRQLQEQFSNALIGNGGGGNHTFMSTIQPGVTMTPHRRLQIYKDTVEANLTQALSMTFPVVRQLVGGHCFQQCIRSFAKRHPSRSVSLNDYGKHFPAWLLTLCDTQIEFAALPYLADVARLEWQWYRLLFAPEPPRSSIMQVHELSMLDQGEQVDKIPVINASLCLIASAFPVGSIWKIHHEHGDSSDDELTAQLTALNGDQAEKVVLWRPVDWQQSHAYQAMQIIDAPVALLLQHVTHGLSLKELAAHMEGQMSPEQFGESIVLAMERGWVIGFGRDGGVRCAVQPNDHLT